MGREQWTFDRLIDAREKGDRRGLSRAITLCESARTEDRQLGARLLRTLPPPAMNTVRLAVSGPPGVGKSTLIDRLGTLLVNQGHHPAVLAIDPTSPLTGGSILGDKTRMAELATLPAAFIRPSPSAGTMGGTGLATREAILLCESWGFDWILIETVGVGQSEIQARSMTDLFLLLVQPGSGDDIQGIKRGINEISDLVAITKADGDLLALARKTEANFRDALGLMGRECTVSLISPVENRGLEELVEAIRKRWRELLQSGEIPVRRAQQRGTWFVDSLRERLLLNLRQHPVWGNRFATMVARAEAGEGPPPLLADEIITEILKN